MSRPRLDPVVKKSQHLLVRTTYSQLQRWKANADAQQAPSLSEWARDTLDQASAAGPQVQIQAPPPISLRQLLVNVARPGGPGRS